ncbi:MAG: DUF3795 domain-containing protein, partial [Proteobacteria bacterium]|nr:DUF3795 domain-containing protein [Pseudomonadota bacterium]
PQQGCRNSMIAYCGIDCSKCPSYLATQSGKHQELEKVAKSLEKVYRTEVKPEYVICDGCRSEGRLSYFCRNKCKMRKCCTDKGFHSCIECFDFPCKELEFELNNAPEAKNNLKKLER